MDSECQFKQGQNKVSIFTQENLGLQINRSVNHPLMSELEYKNIIDDSITTKAMGPHARGLDYLCFLFSMEQPSIDLHSVPSLP